MKKNPIHAALSFVFRNTGRALAVLKYGIIENGWLRVTDLEHDLKVFVGDQSKGSVMVDVGLFIKTGDLAAAIGSAQGVDVNEYPAPVILDYPETALPTMVLDGLQNLLPAVSTDVSRKSLNCVFVNNKKKESVATDGHILLLRKIGVTPKQSFMIDAMSLRIAACFTGNTTYFTICHKMAEKDPAGKSSIEKSFLTLSGNGWQLISSVPAFNEYPLYSKVFPDRSKGRSVMWDAGMQSEVKMFLDKAKPFANAKTGLVHFTAWEGVVRNNDLSYFKKTVFSKDVLPLRAEQVLGLNGEILQKVLRFIGDRADVTVGESMIQPIIWEGVGFKALLMPLKTTDYGAAGISRRALLGEENTVPFPAQEKRTVEGTKDLAKAA